MTTCGRHCASRPWSTRCARTTVPAWRSTSSTPKPIVPPVAGSRVRCRSSGPRARTSGSSATTRASCGTDGLATCAASRSTAATTWPRRRRTRPRPRSASSGRTWAGRADLSADAPDLDALVADADLERGLRRSRGSLPDAAVAPVEARAVTGAHDLVALQRAFAERAATMRAAIVDGEQLLAVAQQQHRRVVDDHAQRLPVPEVRRAGGRSPLLGSRVVHGLGGSYALGEREVATEVAADHQGAGAPEAKRGC